MAISFCLYIFCNSSEINQIKYTIDKHNSKDCLPRLMCASPIESGDLLVGAASVVVDMVVWSLGVLWVLLRSGVSLLCTRPFKSTRHIFFNILGGPVSPCSLLVICLCCSGRPDVNVDVQFRLPLPEVLLWSWRYSVSFTSKPSLRPTVSFPAATTKHKIASTF